MADPYILAFNDRTGTVIVTMSKIDFARLQQAANINTREQGGIEHGATIPGAGFSVDTIIAKSDGLWELSHFRRELESALNRWAKLRDVIDEALAARKQKESK